MYQSCIATVLKLKRKIQNIWEAVREVEKTREGTRECEKGEIEKK
jgi:hypothetical protein